MSENVTSTPTPSATELPDSAWLGEVKSITDAFKSGAADLATAAASIKSLQDSREKRNRIVDGGESIGTHTTAEQAALVGKSYTEAMDDHAMPGSWLWELQRANDRVLDLKLGLTWKKQVLNRRGEDFDIQKALRSSKNFGRLTNLRKKAADDFWEIDNAGQGQEWLPTVYSTQVIPFFALPTGVAANFPRRNIPRGMGIWREPVISARATITAEGEFSSSSLPSSMFPVAADLSGPQSSYLELNPKYKFTGATGCSMEAEEDLIVSVIGVHRAALAQAHAEAMDSCIINGDSCDFDLTTSSDLDGVNRNNVGAGLPDRVFFGLRHYCFYSDRSTTASTIRSPTWTTTAAAVLDSTHVATARAAMGRFGAISPARLRLIVSPIGYLGLVQDNLVKTVDVYGAQATIVTGELGRVWGIPIVVSEWVPDNLPAAGRASGGTGTTSTAILVNPERWALGIKRDLQITALPAVNDDAMYLRSYLRAAFMSAPPQTDTHTWLIIDVRAS